jgi:hypothetical protein
MLPASLFVNDPRSQRPWRAMAHMLCVTAGKFRNPILMLVLMKTDDRGEFFLRHLFSVAEIHDARARLEQGIME